MTQTAGDMPKRAVFVVDDDESVGFGLVMLLKASGFTAKSFSSAEAFLAGPEPSAWDCGLIDYQMPGMDGITLAEQLHGGGAPPPAMVMITGRVSDELERRAAAASVTLVLSKPLAPAEVLDAVHSALAA